jgi:hypothetical protein
MPDLSVDTSVETSRAEGSRVRVPGPSAPGVTDLHTKAELGGIPHLE